MSIKVQAGEETFNSAAALELRHAKEAVMPTLFERAPYSHLLALDALHQRLDRMEGTDKRGLAPLSLDQTDFDFHPDAELHDDGAVTTIRVELPGVDADDVTIEATDDMIEVSGEKANESDVGDGDRYVSERSFGAFYRAFSLPYSIDTAKVEATFDKGVLTIRIPAPAETSSPSQKIAIKS